MSVRERTTELLPRSVHFPRLRGFSIASEESEQRKTEYESEYEDWTCNRNAVIVGE
jgi:hypothetical protein